MDSRRFCECPALVSDRGRISQDVQDAYNAAHRAPCSTRPPPEA